MGKRKNPLINGFYYHIFNRGVDGRLIFQTRLEYKQLLSTIDYYQYSNLPFRHSRFKELALADRLSLMYELDCNNEKRVEITCFCLMPNHFHLLLHQLTDNGVSEFMQQVQDSYTKYFNLKNNRTGVLFSGNFKSVLVESDIQLLHLSRYIHLNPYSSGIVSTVEDVFTYPWSSLNEYMNNSRENITNNKIILDQFNYKIEKYMEFIVNRADYQKRLNNMRHLLLE